MNLPGRPSIRPRHGVALLLVLGALAFISILALAFLGSVNRELTASKSYASGASARLHADAAAQIVIGQLQAATTVDDATSTWVSQPGLIRRYDNKGKLRQAVKLYSSNKVIEGSGFSPLASGGVPSDVPAWSASAPSSQLPWNSESSVYTDLNSPVAVNGRVKYPILNPGGLASATKIQGFEVDPAYGLPDSEDLDGDGNTSEISQIPMPVRWLYLLQDGSLATAETVSGKTIRLILAGGGAVPNDNPPVARIAFWTDDDTCRLNINTASEGHYWTLPVAVAADDSLSSGQVNDKEYQRYPGHPASTSLSPVFDFLTTNTTDLRNFIFAVAPRVSGRGSQFGSRRIGYGLPVNVDNDRLYASVDDLLFLPSVNSSDKKRYLSNTTNIKALKENELDFNFSSFVATSMAGSPYAFTTTFSMDPERLELVRFFLTVGSNSPELNLFGKPRLSLWPVDTRSTHQSIHDRLLAFCSTVNGQPYYFQRQNPNSRTEDYDSIARNQQLLSYLDQMTATEIPGLGGRFSDKYSTSERPQLLTSIFDWIRTVNLAYRDPAGGVQPYAWQSNPATIGTVTDKPPGLPGSGQVLPIKIGSTSGFGRFPTLSKGAFAIVREEELANTPATGQTTVKYRVVFLMETYVPMLGYAGFVPDYQITVSNLALGFEAVTNLAAAAGSTSTVPGSAQSFPLSFQDGSIRVNVPANVEPYTGRAWGGTQGYNTLFLYGDSSSGYRISPRSLGSNNAVSGYPFVSNSFSVVVDSAKKDLIRVGLNSLKTVNVEFKDASGGQTLGTYTLPFEPFGPVAGAFYGDPSALAGDSKLHPKLDKRVEQMAEAYQTISGGNDVAWIAEKNIFGSIDVVRGLELGHGDLRLLGLYGSNAANTFVKHKNYTGTLPQAHSLLSPGGNTWAYSNAGFRVPNETKPPSIARGYLVAGSSAGFASGTPLNYLPQAPSSINGLTPAYAGDFSTGIGSEGDGPHILKADEGNSSSSGLNWGMSVQQPYQNQLFPWDARLSAAFSPNRQVSSAVQLGTLPSRAGSNTPWQTLLFRPDVAATPHPGASSPADSALLDLFWMPVVDPYPVSRPLSTAGKINMNSQIAPFTYIERSTALRGALKSVKVMAFPKEHSEFYKWSGYTVDESKSRWAISYLYEVDPDKTLLFFDERFSNPDSDNNIFKSATEICSIPLAPKQNTSSVIGTGHSENSPAHALSSSNIGGASDAATLRAAIKDFWSKNTLTGDNVWEAPYNHLYPRLTTQSNSYTVYVRAQALQVPATASMDNLADNQIGVTGEYRGSYALERYIDPEDASIPDLASSLSSQTLYPYYQFRIKAAKQFLP